MVKGVATNLCFAWALATAACGDGDNTRPEPGQSGQGGAVANAGASAGGESGGEAGDGAGAPSGSGGRSDGGGGGDAGHDAAGEAGEAAGAGGAAGRAGNVSGVVVDAATHRPLAGRAVHIGAATAVTDADGRFQLDAEAPFDVVVVEPDGATISLYLGLTQEQLRLPHVLSLGSQTRARTADLEGVLSGEGSYPLGDNEGLAIHFLSSQAEGSVQLAPTFGPDYGPMRVAWDGPESVTGVLVTLRSLAEVSGSSHFTGFSAQELTLTDGEAASPSIELAEVGEGHVRGSIEVPAELSVSFTHQVYRVPFSFGSIPISTQETSATDFDVVVPDLGELTGTHCVGAGSSEPWSTTERCGVELDASDVVLTLSRPPALRDPSGSSVTADTVFSWSAFEQGVYRLSLETQAPSATTPNLYVFTSETFTAWPDLGVAGVRFPSGASYEWSVTGFAPAPSLDEALGPNGITAPIRAETRVGRSELRGVGTTP